MKRNTQNENGKKRNEKRGKKKIRKQKEMEFENKDRIEKI